MVYGYDRQNTVKNTTDYFLMERILFSSTMNKNMLDFSQDQNIRIYHECPCRIEISHPRGQNFNNGRGLPCPWLNSDPWVRYLYLTWPGS